MFSVPYVTYFNVLSETQRVEAQSEVEATI